jgi:hypothetical protein
MCLRNSQAIVYKKSTPAIGISAADWPDDQLQKWHECGIFYGAEEDGGASTA